MDRVMTISASNPGLRSDKARLPEQGGPDALVTSAEIEGGSLEADQSVGPVRRHMKPEGTSGQGHASRGVDLGSVVK
jgi:hypothetical protein